MEDVGELIRSVASTVGCVTALLTLSFALAGNYSRKKSEANEWKYRACIGAILSSFCISTFIFFTDNTVGALGIIHLFIICLMMYLFGQAIWLKEGDS